MAAAISATRRRLAIVFPRDHWLSKVMVTLGNTYCRLRGIEFRSFIHPADAIIAQARESGFEVMFREKDLIWHGVVFERVA